MNEELGGLETKVGQIVALCDNLRAENHRLRDRVGELETQKEELAARMTEARTRLEGLMDRLPPE
jgi:cell division protein ZapB